jgi:hypothetical protein
MTTELTEAQIQTLQSAKKTNGRLMCWPEEVTFAELMDLEDKGIMFHVHYGPKTYGHDSHFLVTQCNEKVIAWTYASIKGGVSIDTMTFILNKVCGFDIQETHKIIRESIKIDYPDAWQEFEI